jgi:hypothetical protein
MTDHTQALIRFVLAIVLIAIIALIALWDAYCLIVVGNTNWSVSYYLSEWAKAFPLGILAVGIAIGHIVWPFQARPPS